jgi:hypothetical protein
VQCKLLPIQSLDLGDAVGRFLTNPSGGADSDRCLSQ